MMSENFWKLVEEYQQLGFDPLRWIPTCSNEVDNYVLQYSLKEVKRSNIKLTPSWFDSFYYAEGKIPELTRRVYNFENPVIEKEVEIHSDIALTAGMENLNLLGCTSGFKLFPVYDAPTEQMLDTIRTNLDTFTSRYNIAMEDYSSIKIGNLFFGTTAIANTVKELPTRYDQVEEGMQIIISNKMGAMSALSLYMLTLMDHNNLARFEQNGISLDVLSAAKDETIKSLIEPHFSLGKIISKYCPDFGMAYDKHTHITAVHPVTTDGFFAIGKLAELTNSHIVTNVLPMKYEEIGKFATKELLIENATASSNGCHLIVATKDVATLFVDGLRKHNFEPEIIGFFAKKERPVVTSEIDITQYIASKSKLARLNSLAQTEA